MRKRRKIESNEECLQIFSNDLFKSDYLIQVAEDKSEVYSNLSLDHIYCLSFRIDYLIFYELRSLGCNKDDNILHSINMINEIIKDGKVFSYESCHSIHISNLSDLNSGDIESIEFYLSHEAIGIRCNRLEMVNNPKDYKEVVKELIKEIATLYLINFHNYLVTKPSLTDTQEVLISTIESTLNQWEQAQNGNSIISTPKNIQKDTLTPPSTALSAHTPYAS